MAKTKFTSVMLSAFSRMGSMFKPHLLSEICVLYEHGSTREVRGGQQEAAR